MSTTSDSRDDLVLSLAAANAQLEHRYEQRLAIQTQLRDVATGLHRVMDVDAVLSFGAAELAAALGDRTVIYRVPDTGNVEVVAQCFHDEAAPVREQGGVFLPEQVVEVARRSAHDNETLCIDDVDTDRRLGPPAQLYLGALGVRAAIAAAVRVVEDELLLITVHDLERPHCWSVDDVALFEGIVREITTALRNAIAFEQRRLALRKRIELDREKDDFISNVSHELRTPLTSIIGYLELLTEGESGPLNEGQRELTAVIERNAGRLMVLIEDLLLLSQMQDADAPSARAPVQLAQVLTDVGATLLPQARAAGIELAVVADQGLTAEGDRAELERAVLNVVTNAVKFTPLGGRVDIRAHGSARQLRIQISDSGVGIPGEELERLFERFYRGTAARQGAITGSGLGLAITEKIIARHGGRLRVESTVEVGTTVTIDLPRAGQPALAPSPSHHVPTASSFAATNSLSTEDINALATNGLVR